MSMSNASETALLKLLFNNTVWANVGDAAGLQNSAAAGSFYVALHTADPTDAGNQTTSEASYTGYARVAVARTVGGWTVSDSQVSNTATVQFGECTAGSAPPLPISAWVCSPAARATSSTAVPCRLRGPCLLALPPCSTLQPSRARWTDAYIPLHPLRFCAGHRAPGRRAILPRPPGRRRRGFPRCRFRRSVT